MIVEITENTDKKTKKRFKYEVLFKNGNINIGGCYANEMCSIEALFEKYKEALLQEQEKVDKVVKAI